MLTRLGLLGAVALAITAGDTSCIAGVLLLLACLLVSSASGCFHGAVCVLTMLTHGGVRLTRGCVQCL